MFDDDRFNLRRPINHGLIAGVIALSVSAIGMVDLFAQRQLITGVLTLGQLILFLAMAILGFMVASKSPRGKAWTGLIYGLITGLVAAVPPALLVLLAQVFNVRQFLVNVSPGLIRLLTFDRDIPQGLVLLFAISGVVGLAGAGLQLLPASFRRPILNGLAWTLVIGLLSEILSQRLRTFFGSEITGLIFEGRALGLNAAIIVFLLITGIAAGWQRRGDNVKSRYAQMNPGQRRRIGFGAMVLGILVLVILPNLLGTYLSEVMNNVLIFALMGLGLNIVVGFAGLLDLGYVAFFAIGAYMMGLLTSQGGLGVAGISFWAALPLCVAVSVLAGIMLGIPVLRMRGDYLAIVTLGFGEIIRILALSDLLKPVIGGAQGVLQIPKPQVFGISLIKPELLYYVVLAGILLAVFISYRLSEARIGRQWMAVREDEDVAEAMGIPLVNTKLLAFAIGAAFAGMAGAIFASKLTSIFPHSFNLLISINVLSLIIVGGMGSLPGVIVGALVLVGLPELLREFAEYRYLMYGVLLIVMMLARPEGFWPSAARRRELHIHEEEAPPEHPETAAAPASD
jgi:branched-chain amino acid transport system permease protein